jgi:TolB-like protein/tetratricopeptide (TPR) repeat protein
MLISKYSLAVLPFLNISSDRENEYFSDGITEEIINALANIEGVHITSRTSSFAFKQSTTDIREIAKKLGVSFILEGSVRKSAGQVRITAQLIKADSGFHLWSDSWDRELKDIFVLQDEIAGIIAKKVNSNIRLTGFHPGNAVENTEAIECYMQGMYYLNAWDLRQGKHIIELFNRAVELAPRFAKAYLGLCNVYTWLGATGVIGLEEAHAKVAEYITVIKELDGNIPEVYLLEGGKNFWIEWDLDRAMENLNIALDLKPSYADAYTVKGIILAVLGNVDEALNHIFKAERLDPYANNINSLIGLIYRRIGEYPKALEFIEKNIKICPTWDAQYLTKVEALCKLERYEEAWETIRMLDSQPDSLLPVAQIKALYFAHRSMKEEAYEQIRLSEEQKKLHSGLGSLNYGLYPEIYLTLEEDQKALQSLEQAFQERSTLLLFIEIDKAWDHLKGHPIYRKIIQKVKHSGKVSADATRKYRKSSLSESKAREIEAKLNAFMSESRVFLNQGLNLSDLAEAAETSSNTLSQVLNEHIGKSFYDYVNSFRLDHLLRIQPDHRYRNYTILALAYECGFNSKTTFNSFFKKALDKTPSEYFGNRV